MTSLNSQDLFNPNSMWGNTPSKGAASFDDVTPSHPQPPSLPQHGAPGVATYPYPSGNQIAGGSEATAYPSPPNPPSSSTHRGRQPSVPRPPAIPPQQLITGLTQDYPSHLTPAWSPGSDTTPVSAGGGRHSSRSGSHVGQKSYNPTSPTQSLFGNNGGRPRRTSSQHPDYDPPEGPPPTHAQDDTRMSVDTSSGGPRCLIPNCPYPAFFDVAEEQQTEYCGQRHELQAIETGFVKPCAMCKGRPRRTNERVCGPICRERERLSFTVQGSYYGASVVRREPRR